MSLLSHASIASFLSPMSDSSITRRHKDCVDPAQFSALLGVLRAVLCRLAGHFSVLEFALCAKMQAAICPVSTPVLPPGHRELSTLSSSAFSGKQFTRVASLSSQARPTPVQRGRQLPRCAADYYKTLGVSRSATKQDIKSSYRRLARKVRRGNPLI